MINVALLGFGTVGTGVAEVLTMNRELIAQRVGQQVELKYILHLLAQGVRTAEAEVVSEAVPVDAASVEPFAGNVQEIVAQAHGTLDK